MQDIINYFKLQNKAKSIVTDNGSNFVKAFKKFAKKKELAPISDSEYETASDAEPPFDYGADDADLESSHLSETGTIDTSAVQEEEASNDSGPPSAGALIEEHLEKLAKATELAREAERAFQSALRGAEREEEEQEEESSSSEDEQQEQQSLPVAEQLPQISLPVHFR